jgi:predicted  nucleic acid-binding Zn-ribbon protein
MSAKTHLCLVPAALLLLPVIASPASDKNELQTPKGIVDCLLPGPLRRVGGNMYQMPQRPARLTANECIIRGGDFLLYDRANYETTLKHWITQAERGSGDADAMLYVGEIYEQGIGREPDYAAAASWYQKAADAGSTTAMISLAHLYKAGRGVPMDLATAQALYSQAFGSEIPIPLDPTSVKGADQRIETLMAEVDEVRRQKIAIDLELQASNEQLAIARQALDDVFAGDGENADLIRELQTSVATKESDIVSYQVNLDAINAENAELTSLRQQLEEQKVEMTRLQDLMAAAESEAESSRRHLAEQKQALDARETEFEALLADTDADRDAIQASSKARDKQRDKIRNLEAALRKAEEEKVLYQVLASDSTTQQDRVATLTARIAVLEQKSASVESEFGMLQNELVVTRERLEEQVKASTRDTQVSAAELAVRDDEIERLRAAVARAENESNRHRGDIDNLNHQSLELEQLRAELEREQAQSNRLQQLLTDLQDQYSDSNDQLEQVDATRARLEGEIATLRASASDGDKELLNRRENELKLANDELGNLRARVTESEQEFRRYQQQMADTATRQSTAIENLRKAVASSRVERGHLEEQLSSAHQQLVSAQSDLELERQRYIAVQDELREARAQNTTDAEALQAKQRMLDEESRQVALLNQEIERLNDQSNRYSAQINELNERAQAKKIDFVGPKIILAEPSEGVLASSETATRGGGPATRGISVVAAASVRESRSIRGYVEAPAGLASLTVNGFMVPFDTKNAFAQTIELQGELTPIKIVARDAGGKETVKEFEYRLGADAVSTAKVYNKEARIQDSLLGGLRYYALMIANEDYENEDFASDLKTPVVDVKTIGGMLSEHYGFEVEYLINADYDQMSDALERVIYREQKDDDPDNDKDAILIYYAGHGLAARVLGDNVRYFWMPVDASKNSPRTWYETIEISKYLKESSIPQIMVIADSCYAGNLPSRDGMFDLAEPEHSPLFARYVEKRTKMRSRFVFTSGGNEPVLDDGGDGHSVFARELLNVLQENNGLLAAYQLQGRVTPRVEQASAMAGKEQSPYFGYLGTAGHDFGEFFFPAPNNDDSRSGSLQEFTPVIDLLSAVAQTETR